MAADLPAITMAVCELYQRLCGWPGRTGLDCRTDRLHDRLHAIGSATRPRLCDPGNRLRRAAVRRTGRDRVADDASISASSLRAQRPIPRESIDEKKVADACF